MSYNMALYYGFEKISSTKLQGPATGDINMGSFDITHGSPSNASHVTNKAYVDGQIASIGLSGTATGDINMGSFDITQSNAPTSNNILTNKKYVDDKIALVGLSGTATGDIDMNQFGIKNLPAPTNANEPVILALIDAIIPIGIIVMWSGKAVPTKWALCDGSNGTPNLTNRFIISRNLTSIHQTGGSAQRTLTIDNLPAHHHKIGGYSNIAPITPTTDTATKGAYNEFNTGKCEGGERRVTTNEVGGGQAFDIVPPYYALAFIMYIG